MILTKTVTYRGKEVPVDSLKNNSIIPLIVKCDVCGKEFTTTKYRLMRNHHELCQKCAIRQKRGKDLPIGFQSGRLTVLHPSERAGYSVCKCECGNETTVDNYLLRIHKTKSCGCLRSENAKRIAKEYLSEFQHGSSHSRWKGGIAPERNCIESTNEYKEWKRDVLSKGKCEKCGRTENLVPHHICNFRDYPKIRMDRENGACLCQECHREFHRIYGIKNNTVEQFNEFIKEG